MNRILVMLALVSACTPSEPARRPLATLNAVMIQGPSSLDPAAVSDAESVQVVTQIFEGLVREGADSAENAIVLPCLATTWKESPDHLSWTFDLRRRVRFHDGTELNAKAVVLSFERQRDQKHPFHFGGFTYWESLFNHIRRVERVSQFKVRILLTRPFAPFLEYLSLFPVSVVSPKQLKAQGRKFAQKPVGTGPYRLLRWDRGERVVLMRHDSYWGAAPKLERLIFEVVPEAQRRLTLLESKRAHVAFALSAAGRQVARLNPDLRLIRARGNNVAYVALNTRSPFFKSRDARRAMNHAVRKDALVKLVYQGLGVPARGPLPPNVSGYHPEVRTYSHSLKLARELLKSAGPLPRRPARLYLTSSPRPYLPEPVLAARIIKQNLAEAGLEVELVVLPFVEYMRATQKGDHDLCLAGWTGDTTDPDTFLWFLMGQAADGQESGARNLAMFNDEEMQKLLQAARRSHVPAARLDLYREAQVIIADAAPWVPLAHSDMVVAVLKEVQGLISLPSTTVNFHHAEVVARESGR